MHSPNESLKLLTTLMLTANKLTKQEFYISDLTLFKLQNTSSPLKQFSAPPPIYTHHIPSYLLFMKENSSSLSNLIYKINYLLP